MAKTVTFTDEEVKKVRNAISLRQESVQKSTIEDELDGTDLADAEREIACLEEADKKLCIKIEPTRKIEQRKVKPMEKNDIVIKEIWEARAYGSSLAVKAHIIQNDLNMNVTLIIPYELKPTLSVIGKNWSEIRQTQIEVDELEERILIAKRKIVDLNSALSWRD